MCAYELMLGIYFIHTFITLVVRYADWSVNFSHLAKLFDIIVHLLIGQNRECLIVFERYILVLCQEWRVSYRSIRYEGECAVFTVVIEIWSS